MTPAPAVAILEGANQPRSEIMKSLMFHAILSEEADKWNDFLTAAALVDLPEEAERLAQNVWLLPVRGELWLELSRIARQHAIACRCLSIVHRSEWQRLP
jgi:hypothetical protein